jgi:hypothetical protein
MVDHKRAIPWLSKQNDSCYRDRLFCISEAALGVFGLQITLSLYLLK